MTAPAVTTATGPKTLFGRLCAKEMPPLVEHPALLPFETSKGSRSNAKASVAVPTGAVTPVMPTVPACISNNFAPPLSCVSVVSHIMTTCGTLTTAASHSTGPGTFGPGTPGCTDLLTPGIAVATTGHLVHAVEAPCVGPNDAYFL